MTLAEQEREEKKLQQEREEKRLQQERKMLIGNRITALRMQLGKSEALLSRELGKDKGYLQNITSGRAFPSMEMLKSAIILKLRRKNFFQYNQYL